jgi:RNA polymerase sigma-70 factor (ECF subfamily)
MKLFPRRGTTAAMEVELATPGDGPLWVRARGGAEASAQVHRLYVEQGAQLRSVLRRLTDGRDVEDLVQEVFVVALGRYDQLARADSPRAWLLGVAVKVAAGHRRRGWVRGWFGLGVEREREPVAHGTPEHDALRRDAERVVRRALEALSPRKREVFVLFELEGLSGQEIAAAVGCPLKTVWTRLFHARKDFARALEAMGVTHG